MSREWILWSAVVALGLPVQGCGGRVERRALVVEAAEPEAARGEPAMLAALTKPAREVHRASKAQVDPSPDDPGAVLHWAEKLLEDFRADDTPRNAQAAKAKLWWRYDVPLEPFVSALKSEDRQQRLFAADYLRHRQMKPTDDLVEVCLEAIAFHEDDLGGELPFLLARSVRYLGWNVDKVRKKLLRGLQSGDGQLRFYCAAILARSRSRVALPAICSILASHLEDNDVRLDAGVAALALRELGEAAQPYVSFEKHGASEQAWTVLRLLELSHVNRTVLEEQEYLQLQRQDRIGVLHRRWRGWARQALPMGRALSELPRWR